jgi:hypothetical protein
MERRVRPGIAFEDALDDSRQSRLLQEGRDYSGRAPGVAPGEIAPPPTWRPLAGASANNRGQGRIHTLNTLAAIPETIEPSIVETPRGDGGFDGELISVRLGIELPEPLKNAVAGSPYAEVPIDITCLLDFGIGGVSYKAEVDWNQGTVFGISSSFVRVSARIGAIPALFAPQPPIDIVLMASLAYGDASNTGISAEARRTLNLGNLDALVPGFPRITSLLAGAFSPILPIPIWAAGLTLTDAGAFILGSFVPIAPDTTITLFDGTGQVSVQYRVIDRTNVANQIEGQFPVPVQSRFIRIQNNLAVPIMSPRAIFNLSL